MTTKAKVKTRGQQIAATRKRRGCLAEAAANPPASATTKAPVQEHPTADEVRDYLVRTNVHANYATYYEEIAETCRRLWPAQVAHRAWVDRQCGRYHLLPGDEPVQDDKRRIERELTAIMGFDHHATNTLLEALGLPERITAPPASDCTYFGGAGGGWVNAKRGLAAWTGTPAELEPVKG